MRIHDVAQQLDSTLTRVAVDSGTRVTNIDNNGMSDLLVSNLIRTNEMQVEFLSEYLVAMPFTRCLSRRICIG